MSLKVQTMESILLNCDIYHAFIYPPSYCNFWTLVMVKCFDEVCHCKFELPSQIVMCPLLVFVFSCVWR